MLGSDRGPVTGAAAAASNPLAEPVTAGEYLRTLEEERRLHLNSWVGTPQYMAPEIVAREAYTKAVDFWAAGIVCYDCLVGSTPFNPRVGSGDPQEMHKMDAVSWLRALGALALRLHYFL